MIHPDSGVHFSKEVVHVRLCVDRSTSNVIIEVENNAYTAELFRFIMASGNTIDLHRTLIFFICSKRNMRSDPLRLRKILGKHGFVVRNYMFIKQLFHVPKLGNLSYIRRFIIHMRILRISVSVSPEHMPHNDEQIYLFLDAVLSVPKTSEGCIIEAGCFKGISAAKFSYIAKLTGRRLVLFDSFEGLPENTEEHSTSILGHSIQGWFKKGNYRGSLEEVKNNIAKFGHIDSCVFVKGWFDETMPTFKEKICGAYIDVDLASSTRVCLKYLYPLLIPGGVLVSQDGDFPLVINVFKDDDFWEKEVGCKRPFIQGLGTEKMLRIIKSAE